MDGDRSSTNGPGCSASAEPTQTSQTMYVEPNAQHRSSAAYCKGGGGVHQSQSEPIRANQSQSVPISANQCQSMPIRANQSQTEPIIRGHQHAIISMPSSACNHAPAPGRLARWAACNQHAITHLLQGGWLGGPFAAFPRHVAPPGQRGIRAHIRQAARVVHSRQVDRVVLSQRRRMHSGMLLCGADGSEGDEDLAELVLAHLMREAINEDMREAIHESIHANQSQSSAPPPHARLVVRAVSAREPRAPDEGGNHGSSVAISERSRAAST